MAGPGLTTEKIEVAGIMFTSIGPTLITSIPTLVSFSKTVIFQWDSEAIPLAIAPWRSWTCHVHDLSH